MLEAHQKLGLDMPVNLKLCLEGMEESGSIGLEEAIDAEIAKGDASFFAGVDACCISDNYWCVAGQWRGYVASLYGGVAVWPGCTVAWLCGQPASLHRCRGRVECSRRPCTRVHSFAYRHRICSPTQAGHPQALHHLRAARHRHVPAGGDRVHQGPAQRRARRRHPRGGVRRDEGHEQPTEQRRCDPWGLTRAPCHAPRHTTHHAPAMPSPSHTPCLRDAPRNVPARWNMLRASGSQLTACSAYCRS